MANTFPNIDECVFCSGPVRPATRGEVQERLRTAGAQFRAMARGHERPWFICPACGPQSVITWLTVPLETH